MLKVKQLVETYNRKYAELFSKVSDVINNSTEIMQYQFCLDLFNFLMLLLPSGSGMLVIHSTNCNRHFNSNLQSTQLSYCSKITYKIW